MLALILVILWTCIFKRTKTIWESSFGKIKVYYSDIMKDGFDVPCLTYLYNDTPLKKHLLIQTISRVKRKYPRKEYVMVIDYIGIRDNMREATKLYGGNTSVASTSDDVEQATSVFREELEVLKNMFTGYDLSPFINMECNPIDRYRLLAKAAH